MLLADIGEDFLVAEVFVIEVGDFAVEAIDIIQIEFAWSEGLASLGGGGPADSTDTGKVDMQIVGSTWVFIANLQGRCAGGVAWIAVDAQLDIIDVLITGDRGFGIQRVAGAGKKKVGNKIRAAFRPVLLDRSA